MTSKQFLENLNKYWATPVIAIVGGVLGIYFSVVKDSLDSQAQRLENAALKIESEIRQRGVYEQPENTNVW